MRSAMRRTTSRGVKCSPASSLFSSLKRRISSSKIVPIMWLGWESDGAVTIQHWIRAQIDGGVKKLLNQVTEDIRPNQRGDLVVELELVEDLLDVGREPF